MKYEDKQMVQYYNTNGYSLREIESATGLSRSAIHRVVNKEIEPSELPEIIGDGCYYTSTSTGELVGSEDEYHEEHLNITDNIGQMDKIDSGYPDIYYNERTRQWDVFLHNKRIWRATKLTKACEVRLNKGGLSNKHKELLQAVVDSSDEVKEALNYPPI